MTKVPLEVTMMKRIGELKAERVHDLNQIGGLQEEVARLKAEVEELKSQPDPLTAYLYADTLRRDDIKTLKAHIERLTKAGYAMAVKINVHGINDRFTDSQKLVDDWSNAAKEGKQS
jgi:predicted RNase H-like nuclease (RuvC/YqgF family)